MSGDGGRPVSEKKLPKIGKTVSWRFPVGTFAQENPYSQFEVDPVEGTVVDHYKTPEPLGSLKVEFVILEEDEAGNEVTKTLTSKVLQNWLL